MNYKRWVKTASMLLLASTSLSFCSQARAESPALFENPLGVRRHLSFGPDAGVFLPSSGKTRSRFGDAWFSIGVGFGAIRNVAVKGKIEPDYHLFYQTRGDNHAFILPVGLSYRHALTRRSSYTPYVGGSANLYITDLRSDVDNIHSRIRFAPGGSVLLGVNAGRHAFLEARYYLVDRIRGIDLSGANFSVGYRF